jgi:regulator of protease activity HflC (stomatin/prohibitin superfamily)
MHRALLLIAFLLFFFLNCVHRVRNDERFAVFRLGRFARVKGPGWIFILPFFEKKFRINLNRHFPGWEKIPERELAEKIGRYVGGKKI